MAASESKPCPTLGFLTVVVDAEGAHVGGYLAVNPVGRPLEFLCTAPVKPNRALQILYGPTLAPYLDGEQIAAALIQKVTLKPVAVCTDCPSVLTAQALVSQPVVLVEPPEESTPETGKTIPPEVATPKFRLDVAHELPSPFLSSSLGRFRLTVDSAVARRVGGVTNLLAAWGDDFDLSEPFARIREAIQETQRGGR